MGHYISNRVITLNMFLLFSFRYLEIYDLSFMWYTPMSCILCVILGVAVSVITTPQNIKQLNPDLISPLFFNVLRKCPSLANLLFQKKYFESEIGSEYVSILLTTIQ